MTTGPTGDDRPDGAAFPGATSWSPVTATTIGSVHVRDQLPLQDAVHTWADRAAGHAVIAVADGHGHKLHFRSDTGAALAVISAVEELRRLLPEIDAQRDAPEALTERLRETGARLVDTWRDKVGHHVAAHPFDDAELGRGAGDDPLRAYGTTILAAAFTRQTIAFLQIGDGDSVMVSASGEAARPLPEDPDLDGLHTSSLCQPAPLKALRVAVVDVAADDVALVFLCTDGFGRSRVDADGWWRQTGEQLLQFTRERGLAWVGEQLPGWLEEPALIGGDDTTMALVARSTIGGVARPDLADTVPVPEA